MTSSPLAPSEYEYNEDLNDLDDDYYNDNAQDYEPEDYELEQVTESNIPVAEITTIEVVNMPNKGIGAWLDHVNRKNKRLSILERLKSLVF